jgi:site-specific DNA-methyltransferase (adenine-specific)/site-specific DNA-methyltransferase (cytosine-N4-specific)
MVQETLFVVDEFTAIEDPTLGQGYLLNGNVEDCLKTLEAESVQCIVTSPPYWGLRDYGVPGQIGAEDTVDEFIARLVGVFDHCRRVLKDDGVFWLNVGDAFTSGGRTWRQSDSKLPARGMDYRPQTPEGMKPKDLIGVPWMLAFALRSAGWYLRTDIIWNKPNANPESVRDRPTRSHEFVFMLTKSERYFYDVEATLEPTDDQKRLRRKRSVWNVNTEPYSEAHFAVFPARLVEPCVLASTRTGDVVLDPFFGSGTVGQVARNFGRDFIGIELSREYCQIAERRLFERSGGYELPVVQVSPSSKCHV